MEEERMQDVDQTQRTAIAAQLELERRHKSGAHWFFWIAALSVINSSITLFGGGWSFIVGLGITQFVDAIAAAAAEEAGSEVGFTVHLIGFVISLVIAGVFVIFGVLARNRSTIAHVIGMVLYALDGLLFLLVGDLLSVAFHAFVFFCLLSGLKAGRELARQEAPVPAGSP